MRLATLERFSSLAVLLAAAAGTPLLVASAAKGDVCSAASGNCLVAHQGVGCDDVDCCTLVCAANPLCCDVAWDEDCALTADQSCVGLCGATASLDCFVTHDTPACDDVECCTTVCQLDDFCCNVRWDTACAFSASLNCEATGTFTCGDPGAGSCFKPHGNPACDDLECCEAICIVSPTCCENTWDLICAGLANTNCVGFCTPTCPAGAITENEACDEDKNDPCYYPSPNPVLQTTVCGTPICGRVTQLTTPTFKPDVDVYAITIVDSNGDGVAGVRLSLQSAFDGFATLVPSVGCPPLGSASVHVQSNLCFDVVSEPACIAPGNYWLVVAPGSFPIPSAQGLSCSSANQYVVRVLCNDSECAEPCNPDAGDCFVFHKGVGCNDVECCQETCAIEPLCCSLQWDDTCVQTAISLCAPPPANDFCENATVVTEGSTPFTTFAATASGPTVPAVCNEGVDVNTKDIWFRYTPAKDAVVSFTTCGAALTFDSAMAVYKAGSNGCANMTLLSCDDDASGACLPSFASRVQVGVDCGVTYLIRIGGDYGEGTLTISFVTSGPACPPPCVADLDGNGNVGPTDLGILLGAWGGTGAADLDGNGSVGPTDLGILLGAWGNCP